MWCRAIRIFPKRDGSTISTHSRMIILPHVQVYICSKFPYILSFTITMRERYALSLDPACPGLRPMYPWFEVKAEKTGQDWETSPGRNKKIIATEVLPVNRKDVRSTGIKEVMQVHTYCRVLSFTLKNCTDVYVTAY